MNSTLEFNLYRLKVFTFNILVHRRFDLPRAIGIETSTACNRRCSYCPQSTSPKKQEIISEEIWNKFIERLQEYKWRGATSIIKYNEPSLIPESESYVQELHKIGCRPIIFSNGDRPSVVRKWCEQGAFRVIITQHPPTKEGWYEKLLEVQRDYPRVVRIKKLTWVHNQAGKVEGDKFEKCYNAHGLSINIDGTVSMCCVDYGSEYLVGDIKTQSLAEIWDSKGFREIRNKVSKGIPATEMCKNCLK